MRLGKKANETRSWPTSYRGDLVICAAKKKMTKDDFDTLHIIVEPPNPKSFVPPYGCALCVVELFDCLATDPCSKFVKDLSFTEFQLGNYDYGRFAWRTRNLRPLKEPVPIVGRQGLWTLTPDEEKAVRAQL